MTNKRDSRRDFSTTVSIQAPRERVWNAIADAREVRRWFAPQASVELRLGGEIVWEWNQHTRWPQQIELIEPGARLRTRYDSNVEDGQGNKQPLYVDFLLEGDGGTTTLRVVQSGFGPEASFDEEYDGISQGWPVELRSLRLYVENHWGRDRALCWLTCGVSLDASEAWNRLTGQHGLRCGPGVSEMREGDRFRIETADGDVIEGTALQCHPHGFSGLATSHNKAFFRFSTEVFGGEAHPWCWLGAYDVSATEVNGLQQRWAAMFDRLWGSSRTGPRRFE